MQLKQIAEIVEVEGLAYALTDGGYIRPEDFEDGELTLSAWQVKEGLARLNRALEPYL